MAYYEDLTTFVYGREQPNENILNVGWLSDSEHFHKGKVSNDFLSALKVLVENPVNLYRGVHHCEFCPPPIYEPIPNRIVSRIVRDCPNGNGEIRIQYKDKTFVAPVLVYHYVTEHNYKPPSEFIQAVLDSAPNKFLVFFIKKYRCRHYCVFNRRSRVNIIWCYRKT